MSVGSVCVLGEPWLDLLADHVLRQRNFYVRPETFLGVDMFCFLNKGRNSVGQLQIWAREQACLGNERGPSVISVP